MCGLSMHRLAESIALIFATLAAEHSNTVECPFGSNSSVDAAAAGCFAITFPGCAITVLTVSFQLQIEVVLFTHPLRSLPEWEI